jgi:hypothetical protein
MGYHRASALSQKQRPHPLALLSRCIQIMPSSAIVKVFAWFWKIHRWNYIFEGKWNDKLLFFEKNKIIVAAPEVPTISTVKRYFDVSPYLIIEQEGHWEQHSFHFDGSGSIRRWLLEYGVFLSSCKKKQRGCIIASNSEKMDGLQAKFSLWGLGLSSTHTCFTRYHGKSFANFLLCLNF